MERCQFHIAVQVFKVIAQPIWGTGLSILRLIQDTVDHISMVCIFHKFTLQLGKMDFSIMEQWLGAVYLPCCMRPKLWYVLNILLNNYVVILFLCLYIFVACNCSSLLYLYVVVFHCCFCFLLFFSSFLVVVYCMFMLGTAEKQFFEWM